jgi:hypothetical protein
LHIYIYIYILKNLTTICFLVLLMENGLSCYSSMTETSHRALKACDVGTGELTNPYTILVKNLKGRHHLENLWIVKIIILKWIFNT